MSESFVNRLEHIKLVKLRTTLIFVSFAIFLCWALVLLLQQQREIYQSHARSSVSNLAKALDANLTAQVVGVESALNLVVSQMEVQRKQVNLSNKEIRRIQLLAHSQIPFADSVRIINNLGMPLLEDVNDGNVWNDQAYFKYHQKSNFGWLYYSESQIGGTQTKPALLISKRYNLSNGDFGGIVLASIPLTNIVHIFQGLDYGKYGFGVLGYGSDKKVLFDTRFTGASTETAAQENALFLENFDAFQGSKSNAYVAPITNKKDGKEYWQVFQRVGVTPLFLVITADATDYLEGFSLSIASFIVFFTLVIACAVLLAKFFHQYKQQNGLLEKRLDALKSLSASGFVCTDMSGKLLHFSLSFSDMLGYSEDEVRTLDFSKITPNKYRDDDIRHVAALKKIGRYGPYRKQYVRKDGTLLDVELLGLLVHESEDEPVVWTQVSNITHDLRDREALQLAKDHAVAANLSKSEFLATMSHELRTPLNGILGMAQLLARAGVNDEQRIDMAQTILSTGNSLATLLGDLLDCSQMELNKLELRPEPCQVGVLLQDVVSLFKPVAANKKLDLQVHWYGPITQTYRVDAIRLRQMLTNLISNAIKFTSRGSIQVSGCELERSGVEVVLEFVVQDSGIGIEPAKQKLLFQRFVQIESDVIPMSQGTGLGLSIVQGLAKRMGGRVTVDSELGMGSKFSFHIQSILLDDVTIEPSASRSYTEPPAIVISQEPQSKALAESTLIEEGEVCCLVVDDNPINVNVIEMFLRELDIRTISVSDGLQAVNLIKQGLNFSIILMDVHMPVMNGWLATQAIREWEASQSKRRIPIIGLTAGIADHEKQHSLDMGMDDVMFKPVDLDELEKEFSRYLRLS
jgi:PAS domain S-box-containing protein